MDQEIKHPEALFRLLSVLSNDNRYVQMIERWQKNGELKKRGGKIKMCVLMDEMDRRWDEGKAEGRTEGVANGKKICVINMLKRGMSDEDICGLAECTPEFVEEVRNEVFATA